MTRSRAPDRVVVCDFDGTIVDRDLSEMIVRRFAQPGWEEYDRRLERGEIDLETCMRLQWGMIRAETPEVILAYHRRHRRIRPGFDALLALREEGSIDLVIASAGIDFCIRDSLRDFGLEAIELICPHTEFHPDGLSVRCPPLPASGECRDFKEAAVLALGACGQEVAYVGDGLSDLHAAARAPLRFALAGSSLERELARRELPFVPFSDFNEVARSLRARG